jgi:hypothetical protein
MGPPGQDVSEYRGLPPYHQNHIVNGSLPPQVRNWTLWTEMCMHSMEAATELLIIGSVLCSVNY